MALWFPEDHDYDEDVRQTGFRRYKQLMSVRFGQWWKVNLLTLLGFLPLAGGSFTPLPCPASWCSIPAPSWAG